jgi:17beta-estradiol 17-dehydrogenase/3alpha(17beta)-hydroxysteroid dehydrogenase (NAD+)
MLSRSVAIVTGAASGIGQATAVLFARHGARVACVDLAPCTETLAQIARNVVAARDTATDATADADADTSQAAAFRCNISDAVAVRALVADVEATLHAPCDLLVNCAGITRDGWLWKTSESDWDAVLNTNLKGPFLLTQAVSARLLQLQSAAAVGSPSSRTSSSSASSSSSSASSSSGGTGSVVNISSIIGKVGNMGQCNYAASKAGLVGFTKSAAKDLARSGIRVNAVLPGFIETPMSAAVPEKVLHKVRDSIPMQRLGQPEDIAEAALYLCSSRAKYVTGAVLEVTGGLYM